MRGFIITTVLFSLLLVMIFINVHFTEELIENMKNDIALLSTLPCSENEQIIDKLMKNWEKKSIWLSLSVSYDDIEELTDIMDAVSVTNSTENITQFQTNVELLLNEIDEIGRLEKFSIKNIL